MIQETYEGDIKYLQIMDADGNIDQSLMPKDVADQKIVDMYKSMQLARALDAKILSLQRQGRAVTYAPLLGEEATQIGSALAMRQNDIFVPTFRQHGVFLTRGAPLEQMFLYWAGYEEGNALPKGLSTPVAVPVATQLPHAVGVAFAQKYTKTGAVVIAYVGDGGTSEGDFYEALNFAGVWKVPLVIIIENNEWAISLPRANQTASKTLAQKAIAAGIDGMQVDGNDVVAVYKATADAIAKASTGAPTVVECLTYRMSLHTTADDPTKYRPETEVQPWIKKDPLLRVRLYLTKKGLWSDDMQTELEADQSKTIDAALEIAEKFVPDLSSMFKNVYSYMPDVLQEELDDATAANYWQE